MTDVDWQSALTTTAAPKGSTTERSGSALSIALLIGAALLFLGAGLFALGIFHGFEYGSCSTTGYSANYGPVPHCAKGVGWWMLLIFGGLVLLGAGAIVSKAGAFAPPLLFIAIGAPFVALGLRSGHQQLLFNSSSGTGKTFALIFGICFILGGVVWGVFSARGSGAGIGFGSGIAALLSGAAGLAVAFVIASGVSSAIGKTTAPASVGVAPGVTVLSPAAEHAREVALCKTIVASNKLVSVTDRATLTAECNTDPKTAEKRLPAAARKGAVTQTVGLCRQQIGATPGLPAATKSTLIAACESSARNGGSTSGAGLQSVEAQACRQIVIAQVPVADRQAALASCPKP